MKHVQYKFQIFVLVLMSFILGCSEFIVVGVLSDISNDLNVSIAQAGHLVTVFALVYAIITPCITTLLGKYNHFYSLVVLTIIFIIGNLLSFISGNYAMLMFSRVLTATVSGPMISLSLTFTNTIAPPEKKAKLLSYIFSGFSIASVFGIPIGTLISEKLSWTFVFLVIAIISMMTLLLMIVTLPRLAPKKIGSFKKQVQIIKDPRIQIGVLIPMFGLAGFYVFYTYMRPILITVLNIPDSSISVFFFIFGIVSIISNILSGVIAEKSGLKRMHIAFIFQMILFIFMPVLIQSKVSGTITIMLLGVTMYLLNSPIQMFFITVAETDYPESIVLASSFNSIFANFGISLGSFVGSIIVDTIGLNYVGIGGAVIAFITILLLVRLNHLRSTRKSVELSNM